MRKTTLVLLSAVLLIVLAACQKTSTTSTSSTKPGPPWPGKMVLTTEPAQPISGQDTTFLVTLTSASSEPVTGAKVQASLVMPIMDMGKNIVQFSEKGNGVYAGKGQFTMSGPWDVVITASKSGTAGEQTLEVVVKK